VKSIKRANILLLIIIIISQLGAVIFKFIPDFAYEYVYILLPAVFFIMIHKKNFKNTLRLNTLSFKSLIIVILISFLMQPFLMFISALASQLIGNQLDMLLEEGPKYSFWASMFSMAITPAICEEVLMRGAILDAYEGVSLKKAAIMNGLLFGMFHLNLYQFAYTFFMGALLVYVVYITNSIFSAMIIHFINNAISVCIMNLPKSGGGTSSNPAIMDFVIFGGIALSFAYAVIYLVKKLAAYNNVDIRQNEMIMKEPKLFNWPLAVIIVLFLLISIIITLAMFIK